MKSMINETETIREPTLRELIETNSINWTCAVGGKGGFAVVVNFGISNRFLASTRGGVRLFSNLTTIATYLRKLGVSRFDVDTSNYEAGRLRPARPDRAEALRKTRTRLHQADLLDTSYP